MTVTLKLVRILFQKTFLIFSNISKEILFYKVGYNGAGVRKEIFSFLHN